MRIGSSSQFFMLHSRVDQFLERYRRAKNALPNARVCCPSSAMRLGFSIQSCPPPPSPQVVQCLELFEPRSPGFMAGPIKRLSDPVGCAKAMMENLATRSPGNGQTGAADELN
ncbi:hypothetical protein CIRG_01380 [Coccidioides immitis RMSCC 2394]|uniref:Uncharacterized protein n=1 Tax=Coccidioides immitis RMSCC 2394 TaxID=404692 RepID=A0A0J6Y0Q2_COCIT|nr:hypothetical protein CIRG_01380 [Coccidioides immitis RMSCC 2394]